MGEGSEGRREGRAWGDPAEVPELSGQLILRIGSGELGLAVFGAGKGQCGGDSENDGERERAQFEAREGGEDQAEGGADEQCCLAPPWVRAEGVGDVKRDEGSHDEHGDEGWEQGTHGVVPREGRFAEDGGAGWWF